VALNLSQQLAALTSYGVRLMTVGQALDTDASNPSSRLLLTASAGKSLTFTQRSVTVLPKLVKHYSRVAKQIRLTSRQFNSFVECGLTADSCKAMLVQPNLL